MKRFIKGVALSIAGVFAFGMCAFAAPLHTQGVETVDEVSVKYEDYQTAKPYSESVEYVNEDGISFVYDGNYTLTVSGEGRIDELPEIFRSETGIYRLVISEGITAIDEYAFYNFEGINYIIIEGENLSYIGKEAFGGTSYVKNKAEGPIYVGNVLYTYKGEIPTDGEFTLKSGTIGIAENALFGRTEITKIAIPDTVVTIGENAFNSCTSLADVTFGSVVGYVGEDAFFNTEWEKSEEGTVVIGKTLYKYIGNEETVEVPEGIEYISGRAFEGNTNTVKISLPDSVKYICENAFYGCENLSDITFGTGILRVGKNAFEGTNWLVSKPDGVVYVNDIAVFYKGEMHDFTKVEIKDGTSVIEEQLFEEKTYLSQLVIPDSVEYIGKGAFDGCLNLTIVASGRSFAAEYAERNGIPCKEPSDGEDISASGEADGYTWVLYADGTLVFSGEGKASFPSDVNRSTVKTVELSEGITGISANAFENCYLLSVVYFPESLEYVGADAFWGTAWLDQKSGEVYAGNVLHTYVGDVTESVLTVREGTVSISDNVFSDKTALTEIALPESLLYIGEEAFVNCDNLETITGGENVEYIGADAFWGTAWLDGQTGAVYLGKTLYAYNGDVPVGTVFEIENGTVSVSPFACFGLEGISDIVFPQSLVSIGTEAFAGCTGLGKLEIPETVEEFGENVFDGCENVVLCVTRPSAAHEYAKQSGTLFEIEGVSMFGDVNCDGALNIKDLILMAQYVANTVELDDVQKANADVYTDNGESLVVNKNDIERLGEYLAGKQVVLG